MYIITFLESLIPSTSYLIFSIWNVRKPNFEHIYTKIWWNVQFVTVSLISIKFSLIFKKKKPLHCSSLSSPHKICTLNEWLFYCLLHIIKVFLEVSKIIQVWNYIFKNWFLQQEVSVPICTLLDMLALMPLTNCKSFKVYNDILYFQKHIINIFLKISENYFRENHIFKNVFLQQKVSVYFARNVSINSNDII